MPEETKKQDASHLTQADIFQRVTEGYKPSHSQVNSDSPFQYQIKNNKDLPIPNEETNKGNESKESLNKSKSKGELEGEEENLQSPSLTLSQCSGVFKTLDHCLAQNKAWAHSKVQQDPKFFENLVSQQKPKIFWIGCSDSRVR